METEDQFVQHTRQQWRDLRLGAFDERRCREIYRRIRREPTTLIQVPTPEPTIAHSFTIGEQLTLL